MVPTRSSNIISMTASTSAFRYLPASGFAIWFVPQLKKLMPEDYALNVIFWHQLSVRC